MQRDKKKQGRIANAVFVFLIIVTIVLSFPIFWNLVFVDRSYDNSLWPEGSGYLTEPKNKPAVPHDVESMSGDIKIVSVGDDGLFLMQGTLIIINDQLVTRHPGLSLTHACREEPTIEIADYNGDICVLLYGMTVRMDEYGQYVWVEYKESENEENENRNEDTATDWPPYSGYANQNTNRPSQPHSVEPTITNVTITELSGNQYLFTGDSKLEYRESVGLFVHPGATITYLCDDPVRHALPDYNGNLCTLVRGLTVIVNEYGEFVPVKYLPIR